MINRDTVIIKTTIMYNVLFCQGEKRQVKKRVSFFYQGQRVCVIKIDRE